MTISGIAMDVISIGQRLAKGQSGMKIIAKNKTSGKVTEAAIEARETYRQIKTNTNHTPAANKTQIV